MQCFFGHFTLPMFDFSIGMGEDILTTLNFYGMGDPLTLLSVFVPKQRMEMFYDFLVAFRMYLAGLTFIFYCRNRGKGNGDVCRQCHVFRNGHPGGKPYGGNPLPDTGTGGRCDT